MKPRSTSRSTKLPVVVFTGSSAYPEVCGSPAIRGDATSSGLRPPTTPWAVREASIAASDTLTIPSPPAASKAEATAPTHVTSPELFEMNDARALVIPEASTEHHEHNDANESSADSSLPLPVDTFSLAPDRFEAYVRRSDGLADDTAPAAPGAGSAHVETTGS